MAKCGSSDFDMMAHVLELAEHGLYTTKPNPRVGCIIVRDSEIVAEGWHYRSGTDHAEVVALKEAGERARGADVYVNLEPCSHHGQTPPCVNRLIDAGVRRVVVGTQDPNPEIAGGGIRALQEAGIVVEVGVNADASYNLNEGFFLRMNRGTPLVRVKLAATIDGKTASADGGSQWISSLESRADVHHWRAESCAILAGIGTITSDNPRLNARLDAEILQPLRVVIDTHCSLKPDAALFSQEGEVLVAIGSEQASSQAQFDNRTEVISFPNESGQVDLGALIRELGRRGCNNVLVEAGARLAGSFAAQKLVDEYLFYFAPDLLGSGRSMFVLDDILMLQDKIPLNLYETARIGRDLRLRLRPEIKP
ncbi:MAG: riboflavin biosynthesis protein RibD [Acidiferrobacteraceae bacterium]|nr:riboflavin biosynthesis protein RibD [Acidiferrobacteraceae bacterium]